VASGVPMLFARGIRVPEVIDCGSIKSTGDGIKTSIPMFFVGCTKDHWWWYQVCQCSLLVE